MTGIAVEIDELVFHGLCDDDARRAGDAFASELQRLLDVRGLRRPLNAAITERATPAELGRFAAAQVHARIAQ
jgi:hypothetical protein